jgi:hypothetical protein
MSTITTDRPTTAPAIVDEQSPTTDAGPVEPAVQPQRRATSHRVLGWTATIATIGVVAVLAVTAFSGNHSDTPALNEGGRAATEPHVVDKRSDTQRPRRRPNRTRRARHPHVVDKRSDTQRPRRRPNRTRRARHPHVVAVSARTHVVYQRIGAHAGPGRGPDRSNRRGWCASRRRRHASSAVGRRRPQEGVIHRRSAASSRWVRFFSMARAASPRRRGYADCHHWGCQHLDRSTIDRKVCNVSFSTRPTSSSSMYRSWINARSSSDGTTTSMFDRPST